MTREWFAITSCSNEVRAKFSANQKQELSLLKLRVFQRLMSPASIFLALSFSQFSLRPLIGQTYFLTLSGFPATLHLRVKNYSVKHFHTYPFHPRCYDLRTDQIWTWDPCEIKRKKRDWPWVIVTTKLIAYETATFLFRGVFISLSSVRTYIADSFDKGYYMAARRH